MEYGEHFETDSSFIAPSSTTSKYSKEAVRELLAKYFANPTMFKIKDVQGKSIYMTKLYCLLSRECRYIISIVKGDPHPNLYRTPLASQEWECLQTRTLADNHQITVHNYNNRVQGEWKAAIVKTGNSEDSCEYDCEELGLQVSLLLNGDIPEKYQPRGTLHNALETFQTIIKFKNES